MPKTYTVKEVADILGFSTNSIYTFLKEKRIKGVRVGKGRFRIPDEELARILHLSKKPQQPESLLSAPVVDLNTTLQIPDQKRGDALVFAEPEIGRVLKAVGGGLAPNIFDWFIGLSAIIAGAGLFLFNGTLAVGPLTKFVQVYPVIRTVLIASGFGVIISGIIARNHFMHRFFQLALAALGCINAFGLARNGDMEGAMIYGSMGFVILLTNIIPFGGTMSILVYASVIALCAPAALVFFPSDQHIRMFSTLTGWPIATMAVVSMAVSAIVITGLWVGYAGKRRVFIVSAFATMVINMLVAVMYAHLQMWSRSFYFIVLAYFVGILPYWWSIQQNVSRRYRMLLHGIFVGVGGVLLLSLAVINLFQQSSWKNKESEFMNKMQIAQNLLENVTTSVQSALTVAVANRDFVNVIHGSDLVKLTANAKIIYESNPNIRRLVFLDADGSGIAMYPYGEFDEPNFAHREYFQQAKLTGKPFVSGLFMVKPDHISRYVVSIAVPAYGKDGVFIGVVVASLDLDRIDLQLQQIAQEKDGEYFVVADSRGNILLHPDQTLIGTTIPETDPLQRGLNGESGVMYSRFIDKAFGMIAYAEVPILHWSISLRAKMNNVIVLSSLTIWGVIGTAAIMLLSTIVVLVLICTRVCRDKESGP